MLNGGGGNMGFGVFVVMVFQAIETIHRHIQRLAGKGIKWHAIIGDIFFLHIEIRQLNFRWRIDPKANSWCNAPPVTGCTRAEAFGILPHDIHPQGGGVI